MASTTRVTLNGTIYISHRPRINVASNYRGAKTWCNLIIFGGSVLYKGVPFVGIPVPYTVESYSLPLVHSQIHGNLKLSSVSISAFYRLRARLVIQKPAYDTMTSTFIRFPIVWIYLLLIRFTPEVYGQCSWYITLVRSPDIFVMLTPALAVFTLYHNCWVDGHQYRVDTVI